MDIRDKIFYVHAQSVSNYLFFENLKKNSILPKMSPTTLLHSADNLA